MPADGPASTVAPERSELDADSAEWVRSLSSSGRECDAAQTRLHAMLLKIAHAELVRPRHRLDITGPELDDLAHQAAADALLAIIGKVDRFRSESRFTTWAL